MRTLQTINATPIEILTYRNIRLINVSRLATMHAVHASLYSHAFQLSAVGRSHFSFDSNTAEDENKKKEGRVNSLKLSTGEMASNKNSEKLPFYCLADKVMERLHSHTRTHHIKCVEIMMYQILWSLLVSESHTLCDTQMPFYWQNRKSELLIACRDKCGETN